MSAKKFSERDEYMMDVLIYVAFTLMELQDAGICRSDIKLQGVGLQRAKELIEIGFDPPQEDVDEAVLIYSRETPIRLAGYVTGTMH